MEIDIEQFKKDGQQYVDTVVGKLKEEEWDKLQSSKLQQSTPEELELMKSLWSHGFTKGAETSTQLSMAIFDAINKKS